jgi:hypothetical protein
METSYDRSEYIQPNSDGPTTSTGVAQERRHRQHIRRLLGLADDLGAPRWVLRVHDYMIETFGTGNGRAG